MIAQQKHIAFKCLVVLFLLFLWRCSQYSGRGEANLMEGKRVDFSQPVPIDLEAIKLRGKITVLTLNSSSTYFVYRGQPMGFEYEMVKRFARSIGVDVEIKIIPDVNAMFDLLDRGIGDLIACNLAMTRQRHERALFSEPYNLTRQVLVQRLPDGYEKMSESQINDHLVLSAMDMAGKKIHVNRSTSFHERLQNIKDETGVEFDVVHVPGYIDPEKLIRKVADGAIDFTVADDNLAQLNATYYSNIDISVQLSFPQRVGWAVRKSSPNLLNAINSWLEKDRHTSEHAYLFIKYFRASKDQWDKFNSEYSSLQGMRISEYDEILKEYSKILDWDWRLLAAQMYQESKFKENARSWAGAFGLMQFMPSTAEQYGIDTNSTPEEHIRAAILYLSWLDDFWQKRIFDPQERVHFILASYNVGLGHVIDAVNLAVNLGYDPMVWKDNVAECILLKSQSEYYNSDLVKYGYCRGEEPYTYVERILHHYEHYKMVINQG